MEYKNKGDVINFVRQKDYIWQKYLDEGGLGKTALLLDPVINEFFVCKKYEPHDSIDKFEYYENFKNEIRIMHKLFHNNIVRIFNYYLYPNLVTGFILMDYIEGIDIESYLIISPEEINNLFIQIIDAFAYLEKHNILHRDIRPKNILITNDKIVKIIDFGFGKQVLAQNDFDKSISLNWLYEKPDDFSFLIYDFKTEIYFVGRLFESLIRNYNISGFKYGDLLMKMIVKSPVDRIEKFDKIKDELLNENYIFDEYFDYLEKSKLQDFMDNIIKIYAEIDNDVTYFDNIDQLILELENVIKNNLFENEVQNSVDLVRAFIKGYYTYHKGKTVKVDSLKEFVQLLKTSNIEKKNIIKLGIINRLRKIKKKEKQENGSYDEIPF